MYSLVVSTNEINKKILCFRVTLPATSSGPHHARVSGQRVAFSFYAPDVPHSMLSKQPKCEMVDSIPIQCCVCFPATTLRCVSVLVLCLCASHLFGGRFRHVWQLADSRDDRNNTIVSHEQKCPDHKQKCCN